MVLSKSMSSLLLRHKKPSTYLPFLPLYFLKTRPTHCYNFVLIRTNNFVLLHPQHLQGQYNHSSSNNLMVFYTNFCASFLRNHVEYKKLIASGLAGLIHRVDMQACFGLLAFELSLSKIPVSCYKVRAKMLIALVAGKSLKRHLTVLIAYTFYG